MIDIPHLPNTTQPIVPVQPTPVVQGPLQNLPNSMLTNNLLSGIPPAITSQGAGTLIVGMLGPRDASGSAPLTTPLGTMNIYTPLPLPEGSEIGFRILSPGEHFQAQMVSLNGERVTAESLTSPQNSTDEQLATSAQTLAKGGLDPTLFRGVQSQPGTTQPSPIPKPEAALVETTLTTVTTGTVLRTALLNIQPQALQTVLAQAISKGEIPGSAAVLLTSANLPSAFRSTAPEAPATIPVPTEEAISDTFKPGSTLTVRIVAGSLPNNSSGGTMPLASNETLQIASTSGGYGAYGAAEARGARAAGGAASLQLTGTVIGTEAGAGTVLKTSIGTVILPESAALPKGTELTLELISLSPPPAAQSLSMNATPESSQHDTMVLLLKSWGALDDSIHSLQTTSPDLAENLMHNTLPSSVPGQMLAGALTGFISAIREGNSSKWLGRDTVKALKDSGRGDILTHIEHDFAAMRTAFNQPSPVGGWHSLFFPVFDGQQLHQARMYVRDYTQEESEDSPAGKDTRFIVEVDTDSLGGMQFDGLVRQSQGKKQFDLVIRSEKPLPTEMQQDIAGIFTGAGDITGMKGGLIFQVTPEFPITPTNDVLRPTGGGILA